jgi:hypothetical protein
MTGKDCNRDNFSHTHLKPIAPLLLFIALMSQWYISYAVEDYYAHKPRQQGLNLDAVKAYTLSLSDKTMGISFKNLQDLVTFDCKK